MAIFICCGSCALSNLKPKPKLMKKTLTILSIVLIALITLALTSFDHQDTTPTYATITYSTTGKSVFIYYGDQTAQEEVVIMKGENVNNKIVDILNDLSKKGFEIVTSNTHAFNLNLNKEQIGRTNEGNFIEFYYTLKKVR
jgi:hypothetical protein